MRELKVDDMIGYKSPAAVIKSHNIDRLIGVKNIKTYDLPPLRATTKEQQLLDFELKRDNVRNDTPYDMHTEVGDHRELLEKRDRAERLSRGERHDKAYSMVSNFVGNLGIEKHVPGYAKAGSTRAKVGSFFRIKRSKRALEKQKRDHVINHVANKGLEIAKQARPDVDSNVIDAVGHHGKSIIRGIGDAGSKGLKKYNRNERLIKTHIPKSK